MPDYRKKCHECRELMDEFTEWEQTFLRDMQRKSEKEMSPKQKDIIDRLYLKVCEMGEGAREVISTPGTAHQFDIALMDEKGLGLCTVCGAAEGQLTKHCPGKMMTDTQKSMSYAGRLNFINGCWVKT